jgi:hypothetical protein
MHHKQKFLNLNLKTNLVTLKTPNLKLSIKIRALGMPFMIAEYLDRQADRMAKLFTPVHDKEESLPKLERLNKLRNEFINEIIAQFDEHGLE